MDSLANAALADCKATEQQLLHQLPSAGAPLRSGGVPFDAKNGSLPGTEASQSKALQECDGVDGDEDSLRSYLNFLKQIDAGRILFARKINHLGFDSAELLAAHFSAYGCVEHVFVPRSRSVARSQSNRPFVRKRPSGIGFVVMSGSQDVDAILRDGEAQSVAGVTVHLQRFRRQNFSEHS
jgi:hypothetical protein